MFQLFKRLYNYIRVKSATKQANRLARVTKKRHYVIKVHKRIRVYNRTHVNFLIQQGVLHPKLKNALELQKISIYYTV
jgi:hypothetical protein